MDYKFAIQKIFTSFIVAVLLVSCNNVNAEDLRKVVDLKGTWKFSIGDDMEWSKPVFDDSNWDRIHVPSSWEKEGYEGYNGYAWYRKTFRIGELPMEQPIYLMLGRIDDADEVYLNGKLIGKSGDFPPGTNTAYNQQRKYIIPYKYFLANQENTIAIRVYDTHMDGGIVGGKVGIYLDKDIQFLEYTISGDWKFSTGDSREWRLTNYDDSNWKTVNVPSEWSIEGYDDYDGYGWYRKEFVVNRSFSEDELYICLGRIDDYDQVFLNGKLIGDIFKLRKELRFRKGREYAARRTYKIPKGLLKKRGTNVLAVRVFDAKWRGGIYDGPIGIMTKTDHKKYRKKYAKWNSNRSIFDVVFEF